MYACASGTHWKLFPFIKERSAWHSMTMLQRYMSYLDHLVIMVNGSEQIAELFWPIKNLIYTLLIYNANNGLIFTRFRKFLNNALMLLVALNSIFVFIP